MRAVHDKFSFFDLAELEICRSVYSPQCLMMVDEGEFKDSIGAIIYTGNSNVYWQFYTIQNTAKLNNTIIVTYCTMVVNMNG